MSDTAFRKKLAGRDAGVELQMVVEDLLSRYSNTLYTVTCLFLALPSWSPETGGDGGDAVLVEKADILTSTQPDPERCAGLGGTKY